jgi:hypothetical protein
VSCCGLRHVDALCGDCPEGRPVPLSMARLEAARQQHDVERCVHMRRAEWVGNPTVQAEAEAEERRWHAANPPAPKFVGVYGGLRCYTDPRVPPGTYLLDSDYLEELPHMPAPNPKAARAVAYGKAPLDYLERGALEAEARVLEGGALKYGRRNYRDTEMLMSTYVGAMLRHVLAWGSGEDLDPDTGESHLAHLRANTAVLFGSAEAGTLKDDRLDKNTTAAADAVHAAGDREAKSGTYELYARHQHTHRPGEWPEPAGEPAPPARSTRCFECGSSDPALCGRDKPGYLVPKYRVCSCELDRPRDYTVDVGRISNIVDIVGKHPRGTRFLNHEPEPFVVEVACCTGGPVDGLCCADGEFGGCSCGPGPTVAS